MNVRQSLLKVCKWVLRNSNWDAVSLETIIRFEGYEGLRVFHVLIIIIALRLMRVMRVYEGFEGKYLTSSCIYYWFRTFNDWRTLNTTYILYLLYLHMRVYILYLLYLRMRMYILYLLYLRMRVFTHSREEHWRTKDWRRTFCEECAGEEHDAKKCP